VIENFQKTPAVPDGLAVMAQAYYLMDMHDLSGEAAKLLAQNYPNHTSLNSDGRFKYQEKSVSIERSWTNTLTAGLFDKPESIDFDTRHLFNDRYKKLEGEELEETWMNVVTFGIFR
jgi:outer membrane protein assembly factor BamD